jgi:outer membrane lipoprotein-sorting protein
MKKVITIAIVIIIILLLFFIKFDYKIFTFGNNKSNKSADKIKKYILGITSYETNANVTIKSNKNTNEYTIKEQYLKSNNINKTEILEPNNIRGTIFVYDGENLRIENTKLEISYLYKNYKYIGENDLSLSKFIQEYSNSNNAKILEENDNDVIQIKTENKYATYKKLYLNKKNHQPCKLEIQDITQNTKVYILYNEIKINNLQEDDILAFKLKVTKDDI